MTKRSQLLRARNDFSPSISREPAQCAEEHRVDHPEGKEKSRCNAVRHGLTAETVIGVLEDLEDYKAFEAAVIADYDAQSAVERELVLRLASLLWRLRRATTMETGLFELQVRHLGDVKPQQSQRKSVYAVLRRTGWLDTGSQSPSEADGRPTARDSKSLNPSADLATCFLSLANLPNYALDRLGRYEAILWRQAGQTLFALDALGRRRPQERNRYAFFRSRSEQPLDDQEEF
jgi:hypothetical protein